MEKELSGKKFLFYMISFFVVFASVDAFFVFKAINTNTGVITESSYQKGLEYNKVLEIAKNQTQAKTQVFYQDGFLVVELQDASGEYIPNADISVNIYRAINDKYNFDIVLEADNMERYTKKIDLPLKGLWITRLDIQWKNQGKQNHHQTEKTITAY